MPKNDGRQSGQANESSPLLQNEHHDAENDGPEPTTISFEEGDKDDPRQWTKSCKMLNVFIIAIMAISSPLASSMFTPGLAAIAEDLGVKETKVIGALTAFTVTLGIGPLILAPLSETFGRRRMYMICFSVFSLLQIPTALSPNLATLIVCRTLAGFFGSVGIANGGGSLSDMFDPHERATVFGWCKSDGVGIQHAGLK